MGSLVFAWGRYHEGVRTSVPPILFVTLAISAALTGCGPVTEIPASPSASRLKPPATLRLVNLTSERIMLRVGDRNTTPTDGGVISIPWRQRPGSVQLSVVAEGKTIGSEAIELQTGTEQVVIVEGSVNSPRIRVIAADSAAPDSEMATVRLLNLTPNAIEEATPLKLSAKPMAMSAVMKSTPQDVDFSGVIKSGAAVKALEKGAIYTLVVRGNKAELQRDNPPMGMENVGAGPSGG